jgi:hypothetical protein
VTARAWFGLAIALAGGCRSILGIDDLPARGDAAPPGDGAIDGANDDAGKVDADPTIDAVACAPAPIGCNMFTCPGSSHCYYVCSIERSWTSARDQCGIDALGCLVTIDDQDEQDCIDDNAMPTFPDFVWIGFVQDASGIEPAGGWTWECDSSTYVAPNWGGLEPNDDGGVEDCAAMTTAGAWIDASCAQTARYVCEDVP